MLPFCIFPNSWDPFHELPKIGTYSIGKPHWGCREVPRWVPWAKASSGSKNPAGWVRPSKISSSSSSALPVRPLGALNHGETRLLILCYIAALLALVSDLPVFNFIVFDPDF